MNLSKIVSGGQTGADRAGPDFAIEARIPHGGWCPKGRMAEDGPIPSQYGLEEMPTAEYPPRTRKNVQDCDGTVIFTIGAKLAGGSKKTADFAIQYGKRFLHLSAADTTVAQGASKLRAFLADHGIHVVNVAGSRASKEPTVYGVTMEVLRECFAPAL
jgi:Circularly permutated YpsA SLOG family